VIRKPAPNIKTDPSPDNSHPLPKESKRRAVAIPMSEPVTREPKQRLSCRNNESLLSRKQAIEANLARFKEEP
jgi:hypothetical protein